MENAVISFVTHIYKTLSVLEENTSLNEYWRKPPREAATSETPVSQFIHLLTTTAARVLNRLFWPFCWDQFNLKQCGCST